MGCLCASHGLLRTQAAEAPGEKWYYEQRAYPYADIPPGAYHQARDYFVRTFQPEVSAAALPIVGDRWESIGPAPLLEAHGMAQSGRIDTIAVHPGNTNVIYIGAAAGGVWRTVNAGSSWTPLTDSQASLAMGSIAIAPSNPNIIYAGTGDWVGFYGAGLLRSTDGGNSWTQIPGPFDTATGGAKINKVVVSPTNPNHVVIASDMGVFHSTSGGTDLTAASMPTLLGLATDLAMHPTNPNIVYASLYREDICNNRSCGGGIFRSGDGGQTWTRSGEGVVSCSPPPSTNCVLARTHLAIAPTDPNIVYAVIVSPPGTPPGTEESASLAVFRYDDRTTNWTRTATSPAAIGGLCRGQCWYNLALAVQPVDPDGAGPLVAENILYVGGTWKLYRSTDAGTTWANIRDECTGVFHVDIHALAFDANGALYVGSDGGIVRQSNPATVNPTGTCSPGQSTVPGWVDLNSNLGITQFYPGISVHPSDPYLILGGAQDNGVLRYSGSSTWSQLTSQSGGDGGYTAIAASNSSVWWYAIGIGPSLLYTTANGGGNWTEVKGDLDEDGDGTSEFSVFGGFKVTPFVIHPANDKLVILGMGNRVWRTDTGALANDPTCGKRWCKNSPWFSGAVTALAFAPSSTNIYYAGGPGQVHVTTGGGGTCGTCWGNLSIGLPNRIVTDLAVHPSSSTTVYATVSGFCGTSPCPPGQGHVFININGAAWADISGDLPDVPANAIVLDPIDPNIIYVGTDFGIFRGTVDFPGQQPTWELFNRGLPNSPVFDLAANSGTRNLIAATFGRGMFRLQWPTYVDAAWTGFENGTYWYPFNTVAEGVAAVPTGGLLYIKSGTYTGPGNSPIGISKSMTIESYEGAATVGVP